MNSVAAELALAALEIGAIELQPSNPFTWTTGYRMPIYNDNRLLMGSIKHRKLVAKGFAEVIEKSGEKFEVVAGVATGAIAHATTLANDLGLPLVYIRDKPKGHGAGKQVEGIYHEGQKGVVIEDLISTGKSSAAAMVALRQTGVRADLCLSIFNYGFKEAADQFESIGAQVISLLTFPQLLQVAKDNGRLSTSEVELLATWSEAPFAWGEKNGFPQVVKE